MSSNILKNTSLVVLSVLLALMLVQGASAASVEVRGMPYNTGSTDGANISWDFTTFSAFTFPVNKYSNFASGCGEHLYFEDKGDSPSIGCANPTANVIDEGELVYYTKQYPDKFKVYSEETNVTKVKFYYTLPMLGKTYCAIDNDATNLAKVLFKQSEDDRKVLKVGDTWNISGGYSLNLVSVDMEGNKCYFTLNKDGAEIDSGVIAADGTNDENIFTANATFGDNSEHTYFVTFVDSVFASSEDNFAVFKYTWLLDKDKTLEVNADDEFGKFEVEEALATGIKMSNKNAIRLNIDGNTYFTDDWYFKTSDLGKGTNGGFIIYPAMQITSGEQQAATSKPAEVLAEDDNTSTESEIVIVDMAKADDSSAKLSTSAELQGEPVQESTTSAQSPGFTALAGVFMFLVLIIKRT